jgi:hypothetical protein
MDFIHRNAYRIIFLTRTRPSRDRCVVRLLGVKIVFFFFFEYIIANKKKDTWPVACSKGHRYPEKYNQRSKKVIF